MGVAQGISQFSVPQGFVPTQVWCTQGQQPGELMDGGSKGRADLSWSPHGAQLEHPCVAELWQDVLPLPEVDVFTSWAVFSSSHPLLQGPAVHTVPMGAISPALG